MPVTARVVGVARISATGAFIDMPAESGCTAGSDRPQDLQMLTGKPVAAMLDELLSSGTDNVGHLQRWPFHLCARGRLRGVFAGRSSERIQRTRGRVQMRTGHMQINHCLFQAAVTHQYLNLPQIRASFQKVCAKTMP